jgi:two-component system response regulator FixJ
MTAAPMVFVVDNDPAVLDSLRWLIESAGLTAATFPSAEAFLEAYDPQVPGCLVLDVRMPSMSGLQLQQQLAATGRIIPIIYLSGHADVPTVVQTMKAGAVDFVQKPYDDEYLLHRIRHALQCDAELRRVRVSREEAVARLSRLTFREYEVLEAVVSGKPNKRIALDLGVSLKTVEAHRASIMKKTRSQSVAELVQLALGIVPAEMAV